MKTNPLFKIAIFVLFIMITNRINAQNEVNIRGQVKYYNEIQKDSLPLIEANVDLYYYQTTGDSATLVGQTITNFKGIYCFYNIQPREGHYFIMVNQKNRYAITIRNEVKAKSKNTIEFQDIKSILDK
jgi:hypothetical protein